MSVWFNFCNFFILSLLLEQWSKNLNLTFLRLLFRKRSLKQIYPQILLNRVLELKCSNLEKYPFNLIGRERERKMKRDLVTNDSQLGWENKTGRWTTCRFQFLSFCVTP